MITKSPLESEAPPLDLAPATRDERRLASQVEVWLREKTMPANAVLWLPHWDMMRPIRVEDEAHLASLIAGLHVDDWAGVRQRLSRGHWAQVKHMPDATRFVELHPYVHDRPSRPFVWSSLPDLDATEAAARAWEWVRA